MAADRTLVVRYPDWSVLAAGYPATTPVVVMEAGRVVTASAAARTEGVTVGWRRREAQSRCPEVEVVERDVIRDLRAWEPAVAAVEALTPTVEVQAAGVIALPTRGPSRYFGGDRSLAERIAATVDTAVRDTAVRGTAVRDTAGGEEGRQGRGARVGVADGRFAADLAARGGQAITIVDPGGSRRWLAPVPVTALVGHDPTWRDLADLLVRLGIRTLGQLSELPGPDVLARFGPSGAAAHRLARGGDEHPLEARTPPPDLVVVAELDPPADRVDTAAFVAKALAAELQERLGSLGLACTRVAVEAETEHGEILSRLWRHDGALSAAEIAERMRWQLDGWLHSGGGTSGGLTVLRLRPDEIRPDHGQQLGFWGGSAAVDDRVARTLARVQGLLGPDGVATAVLTGGRDPFRQVRLVAWGHAGPDAARSGRQEATPGRPARRAGTGGRPARREGTAPWPGHLPGPAPTLVHDPHRGADLRDAAGRPVDVTGRGLLSGEPAEISLEGARWQPVTAWAGPWTLDERWWDRSARRRQARFQVTVAGGVAHLLVREAGQWWTVATYD